MSRFRRRRRRGGDFTLTLEVRVALKRDRPHYEEAAALQ